MTPPTDAVVIDADDPRYPLRARERLGDAAPASIVARGNLALLECPALVIFSSRKCPGRLILRAYDVGQVIRARGIPIIGGFQSAAEEECRIVALRGDGPIILCLAHDIAAWRYPSEYRAAMDAGRVLLLSPFADGPRRADTRSAQCRDRFVAALASSVLIIHADPAGRTTALAREVLSWGIPVCVLEDEANAHLVKMGVRPVGVGEAGEMVPPATWSELQTDAGAHDKD